MDELVQKIGEVAEEMKDLAQLAEKLYSVEVESIINFHDHNSQRIERCLDGMLDFCFYDEILDIYKKLCRYYINTEVK